MNPMIVLPFLAIIAIFGVLAFVFRSAGSNKAAATRLDILVGKKSRTGETQQDILLKKDAYESDKNRLLEMVTARIPNLQKFFEQADANIKPTSLLLIGGALASLGMVGSLIAKVPTVLAPVTGIIMFVVPFIWLWNKRRVRLNTFAAQLSDALELVARALRAGHSLAAGMHVVAEEMPEPISVEFGRVYEEQNLGIPLEDAMDGMCERVPNLDLRFFVTSVIIQRQTGGDLAEILDKIGYIIRERYKILGQVKALTAEGRLSGVVLIAMPFGLFFMMLHLKPDYISLLWTNPKGVKMLVFAGIMQLVGAAFIKKIVDIKV